MQGRMLVASASYSPAVFVNNGIQNRNGETMHPASRFGSKTKALMAALLLVGTAGAQEVPPAALAAVPKVYRTTVYNGTVPTVSYAVQGGSPHLQALAQALQYTENELNLTGELQKLRLGIVANEQTLDTVRTSQALGLGPISTPGAAACYPPPDSALKQALIPGLAREATPAAAYQLINLREQVLTELQAEQDKMVGAVPGAPRAMPNAQPVAPAAAAQAVAHQVPPPPVGPAAAPQVVAREIPLPQIIVPAPAAPRQVPDPLTQQVLAFQQQVRQNQEMVRQRILQTQQQVMQRSRAILRMHR
jgi:hypothetical protein